VQDTFDACSGVVKVESAGMREVDVDDCMLGIIIIDGNFFVACLSH
jgi:hypothetical protein